ncbi:MAG: hypothetical protein M9949_00290 [Candidatus Kapabacteria bacterium]|nr:hypothetical protein [Candidatus Kapabacteria bacterium]
MKKIILILFALTLAFAGCRTNNLENYDLNRKKIYFEEVVSANARQVDIMYDEGPPTKEKKSTGETIANIAVSVSSIFVGSELENKLMRAVNPDSIAYAVSDGVGSTLRKYLMVEPVWDLEDDAEFVAVTTIEEIQLHSTSGSIYIKVQARTQITSRNDGGVVWENTESESYPLRNYYGAEETAMGRTLKNVLQTTELASLSEDQLRNAINDAATRVGINMAETLRKDIAKSKKAKT